MRALFAIALAAAAPAVPPKAAPTTAAARCGPDGATVRVMLQDLVVAPAFADRKAGLAQVVADEAGKAPGFSVLSAEEVRSALQQEADKQLLGCAQNSCIAEIAEALDAELVISGRLDAAPDGGTLVALTVLNARAVVVVNRVVMTWKGAESDLPEVLRAAAQTLLLDPEKRPAGAIEVVGLPKDARVFVDDVDFTADHEQGALKGQTIGPHVVRAEAPDMAPAFAHVVVKAGNTSTVNMTLEPAGIPTPLLIGGGVGAVLIGGAVALGVIWATAQSDPVVGAAVPSVSVADAERVNK